MFTYYEKDNAPEESKPLLENSEKAFGMIPNLHKILAEAPITYKTYNQAYDDFLKNSGFSKLEAQVVYMTTNFENRCHYCIPGHTWGMKAAKMPDEVIEALRDGAPLPDPKLQALHDFTKALWDNRGHIGDDKLQEFLDAGYTKRQALEVLTGLAAKLISNFTNAITHTKLDEPMKPFEWRHPDEREAA